MQGSQPQSCSVEGSTYPPIRAPAFPLCKTLATLHMFKLVHYAIRTVGTWVVGIRLKCFLVTTCNGSYVFTGICQSFCSWGVGYPGGLGYRGRVSEGIVPRGGSAWGVRVSGVYPTFPIEKKNTKASGTHPAGMFLCFSYI